MADERIRTIERDPDADVFVEREVFVEPDAFMEPDVISDACARMSSHDAADGSP
jgi:hypothetical protein